MWRNELRCCRRWPLLLNKSLARSSNGSQSFAHSGVLCPICFFLSFFRWKSHAPLLGRRVRYSCGWPNCIGFGAILFETSVGSQNLRLLGFREETRVTACVACVQEQTCARSEGNYVRTQLGLSVLRRTLSNVALSSSTKSP